MVRRFSSNAVIGFTFSAGFLVSSVSCAACVASWQVNGALTLQTGPRCRPDIPLLEWASMKWFLFFFPPLRLGTAHNGLELKDVNWRVVSARLSLSSPCPPTSLYRFHWAVISSVNSLRVFCLFITPTQPPRKYQRHLTLCAQKRYLVCPLPQSSYCKYLWIVARPFVWHSDAICRLLTKPTMQNIVCPCYGTRALTSDLIILWSAPVTVLYWFWSCTISHRGGSL